MDFPCLSMLMQVGAFLRSIIQIAIAYIVWFEYLNVLQLVCQGKCIVFCTEPGTEPDVSFLSQ